VNFETGKRAVYALLTALVLTAALTFALPPLYAAATSVSARITAAFAAQGLFFGIAVLSNNFIGKLKLSGLGYTAKNLKPQLLWAAAIFLALTFLFVGIPLAFGLRDIFPARDSLAFAVPYCMAVGFAEETLFRGCILNALLRLKLHKIAAVAVSSLIFGAWHYIGSGNFAQVPVTTVIGAALAVPLVYGKKCGLVSVALAHGAYDALLAAAARIF
jgi:membrane protease YdiL (CAAX protease family)